MNQPTVTVWPHRGVAAGEGAYPSVPLHEALDARFDDDAHVVGYHYPDGDTPRLKVTSPDRERALFSVWFVDLDRPLHAPWPSRKAALAGALRLVDYLGERGEYPAAYATRAGVRLVYPLAEPVPCDRASALLGILVTRLTAQLRGFASLELDRTCGEWNRGYRAPDALREGKRIAYPVHYPDEPWALPLPFSADQLPPDGRTAPEFRGTVPDIVPDARDWYWRIPATSKAGHVKHTLRMQQPLAYDPGQRHTATLGLVRSLARYLTVRYPDPQDKAAALAGIVLPSVAASTDPDAPDVDAVRQMIHDSVTLDRLEDFMNDGSEERDGDLPVLVAHPMGKLYFVLGPGNDYLGPYAGAPATQVIFRTHEEFVQLACSDSGNPWPIGRILAAYGDTANRIRYTALTEETGYDQEEHALTMRLYANRPKVEPEYCEDVETWLTLLFDNNPNAMAWLTWYGDLSQVLPALIISGPKSTGKGMLAQALAAYWGGEAIDWNTIEKSPHALGKLADTPFIYADEFPGFSDKTTPAFRSLTANTTHMANPKNQQLATYDTATRSFFASNKDDCCAIRGQHTAHDLAAIQGRMLAIHNTAAAAEYLAEIGGSHTTRKEGWVVDPVTGKPGKIVRHIAWLQTQRKPAAIGPRFAVAASIDPVLARGALRGNETELSIFGAIAIVAKSSSKAQRSKAVILQGDTALINPRLLHLQWKHTVKELDRPPMPRISRVLNAYGIASEEVDNRLYWRVPMHLVDNAVGALGLDMLSDEERTNVRTFTTSKGKTP